MQNKMHKAHKRAQMAMQERTYNQQKRNAMCESMQHIMQDTSKKNYTKTIDDAYYGAYIM